MNRPYQPSNGTEGMIFTEKYCMNCINCHPDPCHHKQCQILCNALVFHINDKEYPKEWVYIDDEPKCTARVKWDWDNDGDPDDSDNPKAPPPPAPDNQLMLFSIVDKVLENHSVKEEIK
ncbi:hypothetical protein [Aquimarina sp. 2201CG5-10]|uniref:hypothetical protein n=1 Tax=Aquimarina callyspongiae TaxID=3098150 RepID=UPI002AB3A120|nr:hypothetical protein [Aquimarina sp. 2201CG5-10]MDY8137585.1 hypothetical protein [Aquimarina sp. 2201CG5-10]